MKLKAGGEEGDKNNLLLPEGPVKWFMFWLLYCFQYNQRKLHSNLVGVCENDSQSEMRI
jgi:hypothetical protein